MSQMVCTPVPAPKCELFYEPGLLTWVFPRWPLASLWWATLIPPLAEWSHSFMKNLWTKRSLNFISRYLMASLWAKPMYLFWLSLRGDVNTMREHGINKDARGKIRHHSPFPSSNYIQWPQIEGSVPSSVLHIKGVPLKNCLSEYGLCFTSGWLQGSWVQILS